MECPECGSTEWRPHGTYRTVDGCRVQRRICSRPECGRTRTERAGRASFGLETGAELVGAPELDGRQVSRYVRFLLILRAAYAREGLPAATRAACEEVDIARGTGTRWLQKSVRDGFPAEIVSGTVGRGLRAAAHLQVAKWKAPAPSADGTSEVQFEEVSPALGPSLRFARWLASVLRGDPLPSWLDRLWSSSVRFPGDSQLASTWRRVERGVARFAQARDPSSGEALSVGGAREPLLEVWKEDEAGTWLSTRVLGEHAYRWRGQKHGRLRRPAHEYAGMSASAFLERWVPESASLSRRLSCSLERWRDEARRRGAPGRLREKDLQLDRMLRYWMKTEPGLCRLVVATRRRIVGGTTHRDDAVDAESPWVRLRPERRIEDWAAGRVLIPADGLDEPLVLETRDDAVLAPRS